MEIKTKVIARKKQGRLTWCLMQKHDVAMTNFVVNLELGNLGLMIYPCQPY